MARGPGFEPRLPGPEPGVLPLDDPRIIPLFFFKITEKFEKIKNYFYFFD